MSSNIHESMNLPFLIYKYFGLTHLSISKNNKRQSCLISRKVDVAVNTIIVGLICVWVIIHWKLSIQQSVQEDSVLRLNFHSLTVVNTIGIVTILTSALTRSHRLIKIFHQVIRFDMKLHRTTKLRTLYRCKRSSLILLGRLPELVPFTMALTDAVGYFPVSTMITYSVFFLMSLCCSNLHCCFILECSRRAKFVNEYIEKLLFGSRTVACIETKLTPVVDVCYRLQNIRVEMCLLIDTVLDINKYFEVHLFLKISHLFICCLWSAYYIISDYGERCDLLYSLKTNSFLILWCLTCIIEFCADIYVYQRFLKEVSLDLSAEIRIMICTISSKKRSIFHKSS